MNKIYIKGIKYMRDIVIHNMWKEVNQGTGSSALLYVRACPKIMIQYSVVMTLTSSYSKCLHFIHFFKYQYHFKVNVSVNM